MPSVGGGAAHSANERIDQRDPCMTEISRIPCRHREAVCQGGRRYETVLEWHCKPGPFEIGKEPRPSGSGRGVEV